MLIAGLGLKLLGVAGGIWEFIKANWKIILPILLVIVFYFFITGKINAAHDEGRAEGISYQIDLQKKAVDEENTRNREFETMLNTAIGKFGREVVEQAVTRMAKETSIKETIRTTIREKPIYQQCKVDQEILDQRNEIRSLGPTVLRFTLEDGK